MSLLYLRANTCQVQFISSLIYVNVFCVGANTLAGRKEIYKYMHMYLKCKNCAKINKRETLNKRKERNVKKTMKEEWQLKKSLRHISYVASEIYVQRCK